MGGFYVIGTSVMKLLTDKNVLINENFWQLRKNSDFTFQNSLEFISTCQCPEFKIAEASLRTF